MSHFNEINTCNILLNKAVETANYAEKNRDFSPTINGITIGLSSGTSGNKGVFLADEDERALWVALILDRVIGFSLKNRKVAFFLRANSNLYNSINSKILQFRFFDLLLPISRHINDLNQFQPDILVAQPSMLMELASQSIANTLQIKPSKIISVAEVLTPEDKNFLSKIFMQTIHQVYQATEGFLASTCIHGTLHFNEDFLIIEKKYLDDKKNRFHPIITDLLRKSQPIIRYELDDIIIEKADCNCGNKMMGIASIEGRSDEILIFTNSDGEELKLFPDFIRRAILFSDDSIKDYNVVQTDAHSLHLYIESSDTNSFQKAKQSIFALLNKLKVFNVTIEPLYIRNHIKGDKYRKIKNESRKIN